MSEKSEQPGALPDPVTDSSRYPTSNTRWIENDGLLRDDGAVFGTACGQIGLDGGDVLGHKLESIRRYYRKQAAEPEARASFLKDEISRLVATLASLREQEAMLREQMAARQSSVRPPFDALNPSGGAQTLRYVLGFTFNLAGCVLLGVLVYDLLDHSSLQYAPWVGAGVVLLALFNMLHPFSILFTGREVLREHTHEVEHWKLHLTEWLLPVAAASFVAVWAHEEEAYVRSVSVFLLLLGAFLVSGRIVLGSATRLSIACVQGWRVTRQARGEQNEVRRLANLAGRLDDQSVEVEKRLSSTYEEQTRACARVAYLDQQAEEKIELFCSEFELARLSALHEPTPSVHPEPPGFWTNDEEHVVADIALTEPTADD